MCMKNADIYLNAMYTIPISFVRKYGRVAAKYAACMYYVVTCMRVVRKPNEANTKELHETTMRREKKNKRKMK